jgi:hypothetical protein
MGARLVIFIPVVILLFALACGERGTGASIADRQTFPTPTPGPTPVKEEAVQRFMEAWTPTHLLETLSADIEELFGDVNDPEGNPVDKAALAQAVSAASVGEASVTATRVIVIARSKTTQKRRYGADAEYTLPIDLNGSPYVLAFTYQIIADERDEQPIAKAVLSSASVMLTEVP